MAAKAYENESSGISTDRVRDDTSLPALPAFDSLPATAGLINAEAFQLSMKHALALLPRMLNVRSDGADGSENVERFSLR